MSEKQYQAVCYLCETTLEADTWDELQALKAEHGWKEEYDTGM